MTRDYKSLGLIITPDFITIQEEQEILDSIPAENVTKKGISRNRILRYGSSAPYSGVKSQIIPPYLDILSERLVSQSLLEIKPDSVTLNEYLSGQGITPHIDSTGSGPVITVLGILGNATMNFHNHQDKFSIPFLPRCLVQMTGDIRNIWQHSIDPVVKKRYSIVFRCSPKK